MAKNIVFVKYSLIEAWLLNAGWNILLAYLARIKQKNIRQNGIPILNILNFDYGKKRKFFSFVFYLKFIYCKSLSKRANPWHILSRLIRDNVGKNLKAD